MPHTPFIIASFAVAGIAMSWLVISSYVAMRRTEAAADELREKR